MCAMQISSNVAGYALQSQIQTGLNAKVVEAIMQAEHDNSLQSTGNWGAYGNNPFDISVGNPNINRMSTYIQNNGMLAFPNPATGVIAFDYYINNDPNMASVRKAIKTGNPKTEMNAIINSQYAGSGHYTGSDGKKGSLLYGAYDAVTGANYTTPSTASELSGVASDYVGQVATNFGLGSGSGWFTANNIVIVAGVILIIFLLYRAFTN